MANFADRPQQTLYMSQQHVGIALTRAVDLLTEDPASDGALKRNDEGDCSIDQLCETIKAADPRLSYINRNHIIELYFKDTHRKIFITGYDSIRYKQVRYVQPPDILYFGTIDRMVAKMLQYGIKSHTKGYLKLYGTPELAAAFAEKFVSGPEDRVTVLAIDAREAFSSGLKFSTFKPDEYIVVRVDREYIDRNYIWHAS